MILYDTSLIMDFHKYGIMLPISPDRGKNILEFLNKNYSDSKGAVMPFPGPVLNINDALSYLKIESGTAITRDDLQRVHSKNYIDLLYDKKKDSLEQVLLKTYELIDAQGRPHRYEPERAKEPLTGLFSIILARTLGTSLACRLVLANKPGFCYYMGGGMHHARYDSGSGFCMINDVAIAAAKIIADTAQSEKPVRLIWIIDMDAHKGDGTAELIHFARKRGELQTPGTDAINEKPCILTLSIHMAKGWPLDAESLAIAEKDRAPLLPSDVDIEIDSGEEEEYTPRLAEGIKKLELLGGAFFPVIAQEGKPDLVIVVDGADPYEHDELPSSSPLKLTLQQCVQRDNYVYHYLMDRRIPSAWLQAGGYGQRAWEPTAYFLDGIKKR